MIHRPLILTAAAWEGGARPPKTMVGGHGRINPPPPFVSQYKSAPV